MSLLINKAEGLTVYTIRSNPKSKWPLLCQILGTLCYSPVCSVSPKLKKNLGCALTAFATMQIMFGLMNLAFGSFGAAYYPINYFGSIHLGLGAGIIVVGIMCILAEKFPSPCLVVLTVMMNLVSAGCTIAVIVFCSIDLAQSGWWCRRPDRQQSDRYSWRTPSPSEIASGEAEYETRLRTYEACQQNKHLMKSVTNGMDIMMIVLAVLQLCIVISWCVLSLKALCKKEDDEQDVEDQDICKPLMEKETPDPVC